MAKLKLFWVLCVLGTWAVANGDAPSPSVDCSTVLLSMADCLTFVMNGSTISKPEGFCCSGFKAVLKENPMCLCESFNNNNNMGIPLNMTKATTLPSACGVSSTLPFSKCGISAGAPAPVPSLSPKSSKLPGVKGSQSNSTSSEATAETATPTPSQSSAAAISISVASIVTSLAFLVY